MKTTRLLGLFGLILLCVLPASARVTVTRENYEGWRVAYRLSNGTVDVVVVPSIGRIMAFSLTGHPETNPIYDNPAERGQAANAAVPFPKNWTLFGGDKMWPSPQSDWPKHQPLAWPPDPSFDSGPYHLSRIPNGVRLTGPVSPYYHIRAIREIVLPSHGARVTLRETFLKTPGGSAFPVGIWNVTQTRGDGTVFLPVTKHGHFPGSGYYTFTPTFQPLPRHDLSDGLLQITRDPSVSTKAGSDASDGWLASLYGGNVLFSEHFTRVPGASYPDMGCSAEVYTNPGTQTPYIEMELLGPLANLHAGQTLHYTVTWRLQHLPRVPADAAAARRMVRAAMPARRINSRL